MTPQWLDRALLINPFHLTVCTSAEMFGKELKRCKIPKHLRPAFLNPGAHAMIHTFEHVDGKALAFICLDKRSAKRHTTAQVFALLTHEVVHLWQKIKENYGESVPGSECEAYAIQNMVQTVFDEFRRQTK